VLAPRMIELRPRPWSDVPTPERVVLTTNSSG
jgi:hypothetical protein